LIKEESWGGGVRKGNELREMNSWPCSLVSRNGATPKRKNRGGGVTPGGERKVLRSRRRLLSGKEKKKRKKR